MLEGTIPKGNRERKPISLSVAYTQPLILLYPSARSEIPKLKRFKN